MLGRNTLTGPGRNNADLALLKNFSLPWFKGERSQIQFRWETFNTFNHPQWQYVNTGCDGSANQGGSSAFGRPCNEFGQSTAAATLGQACTPGAAKCQIYNASQAQVNTAWLPRIMQLALKFSF